jgi:hypothetical protein
VSYRGGRHITQEMIYHLDAKAGKRHSAEGSVMTTLRELIEMYEASGSRPARLSDIVGPEEAARLAREDRDAQIASRQWRRRILSRRMIRRWVRDSHA